MSSLASSATDAVHLQRTRIVRLNRFDARADRLLRIVLLAAGVLICLLLVAITYQLITGPRWPSRGMGSGHRPHAVDSEPEGVRRVAGALRDADHLSVQPDLRDRPRHRDRAVPEHAGAPVGCGGGRAARRDAGGDPELFVIGLIAFT